MGSKDIADALEEYAEFLQLDEQQGRAHAYRKAARAIRKRGWVPPDPARLNGIGPSTREAVINLENDMGIDELEDLKDTYSWYDEFRDVDHIGPSRAKKIQNVLHIETLDELELAAESGDLEHISGIGPKTAKKIRKSIEALK